MNVTEFLYPAFNRNFQFHRRDPSTVGMDLYGTVRGTDFRYGIFIGTVRGPEFGTKIRTGTDFVTDFKNIEKIKDFESVRIFKKKIQMNFQFRRYGPYGEPFISSIF